MALEASPVNERKRVKVYELKDSDWWDRGTGFVAVHIILHEETLTVESEDNGRPLLHTRVEKEHNYQKQQETLIVWTDSDGLDMALSFQEADGCSLVWSTITEVQAKQGSDGGIITMPEVDLAHLGDIDMLVRNAMNTAQGRDAFMKHVEQEGWLAKLVALVDKAESNQSITDLHNLCNIFKHLILFNNNNFIEDVVSDPMVMGVVGALEYDPDFPEHKANHRQYLADKSRFKQVVTITDTKVQARIHGTFRLQYLKDVVLARILDDPTFSVLNSLIYFYQMDILSHIASNPHIIKELFAVVLEPAADQAPEKMNEAVFFIQQCTSIAKGANATARGGLYTNLVQSGLFAIITFALRNSDAAVRVAGVEIFLTIIDHDAITMRNLIFKSNTDKTKTMTDTLVDLLLSEPDLGVKAQVADAIRILLEPNNSQGAIERAGTAGDVNAVAKFKSSSQQNDQYLAAFFEGSAAKKLFQPLAELETRENFTNLSVHEVSLYGHLVEILTYFVRTHHHKSKLFILDNRLAARVAQLFAVPQKHLKLTAVKYFRAVIAINDDFHYRHLIGENLFEPMLNTLIEGSSRDNLLNSAILELFAHIRKDNIKPFIMHLVELYRDRLEAINIRGIDIFTGIVLRYDQYLHPELMLSLPPGVEDSSFMTSDADTPNTRHVTINGGGTRWQGLKEIDPGEEAYFNASDDDDDEDELGRDGFNSSAMFDASPLSKPLVDYADDEDEDDLPVLRTEDTRTPTKAATLDTVTSSPLIPTDGSPSPATATTPGTPRPVLLSSTPPQPGCLAEKKRRAEEFEDELSKLDARSGFYTSNKRRSSSGGRIDVKPVINYPYEPAESVISDSGRGGTSRTRAKEKEKLMEKEKEKEKEKERPKEKEKAKQKDKDKDAPAVTASPTIRRAPSLKRKAGHAQLGRHRANSRGSTAAALKVVDADLVEQLLFPGGGGGGNDNSLSDRAGGIDGDVEVKMEDAGVSDGAEATAVADPAAGVADEGVAGIKGEKKEEVDSGASIVSADTK